MKKPSASARQGFTIIELLVVVSIIALLIGILLPAINKARDQARITQSKANLRNIGVAHSAYGADFMDRQWTLIRDDFASFNPGAPSPVANCTSYIANTGCHPSILIGTMDTGGGFYVTVVPCEGLVLNPAPNCGGAGYLTPLNYWGTGPGTGPASAQHIGANRMNNVATFTTYMNNRYYDPVFWAPKDKILLDDAEVGMQNAGGMTNNPTPPPWPSYCLSAAAMFSPDVHFFANAFNTNLPSRFKAPPAGAAVYSDLKTRSLEHNWLQNSQSDVNPNLASPSPPAGVFKTPYFYTAAVNSAPVTLFFDGHVDLVGVFDAMDADSRAVKQGGEINGLWCRSTPYFGAGGYYSNGGPAGVNQAYDGIVQTGFHMMTTKGILGRDLSSTGN
jgi:prepilin-type N-terminal cleavage/methylation domain-containing protein